ncbi:MAG: hypothetical protein FD135_829 [Comamonadaceae bacterium]|nr:MAG: hypothetical protein FD135_829 [Comamonadaceae bacterium]
MNQIQTTFGGALSKVLEQVANSATTSISVADACTGESFVAGWIRTLSEHAKHLRIEGRTLQAPAVFVFVDSVGEFAKLHADWTHRLMLGASHIDNFSGVLGVGTAAIGGYTLPATLHDMSSFECELQSSGLQTAPTIALVSESKLLIWPDGIYSGKHIEATLSDDAMPVTLTTIDSELSRFDVSFVRQNTTWWRESKRRCTVENPEATVQNDLWVYLSTVFREVALVRKEEVSGNGRRDLTIYPTTNNPQAQKAILELKTLRDVHTPIKKANAKPTKISLKENIDWACSGVQQTAAYRDSEKADGAFLCLYDFCAENGKAVENAVAPHAKTYNVTPRRYWITASNEEYRKFFYPLNATNDNAVT